MKDNNKIEAEDLNRLKKDVERYISRVLHSPADYIYLSERLQNDGHGYISPTTLKRVWGYISDKGNQYTPSSYTLNSLCKFIGFNDISEYCSESVEIQSKEYQGKYVDTLSLPADTEITLMWPPNRKVRLRHTGPECFEVVENENSRLRIGDNVQCSSLTQHAPAFFRVRREGNKPFSYIAGSDQGIFYHVHSQI
ncbi:MAG: hypothetical protein K2J82_01560 [Muribaculaceae bacterium]|nr:hypothetical protein [Muribaculaceae bacterium]MDE6753280.1 hypothetical protein [Muribaculaceae bacterium]